MTGSLFPKILFRETVSSSIMPLTDVSNGTETSFLMCSTIFIFFPSFLSCLIQACQVNKLLSKTRISFTFIAIIRITFDVKIRNHPINRQLIQYTSEIPM